MKGSNKKSGSKKGSSKKSADKKGSGKKPGSTERARSAAIKDIGEHIKRLEAGANMDPDARLDHEQPSAKELANDANLEASARADAKQKRAPKAKKEPKAKKVSALDAAAQVLAASDTPMTVKDMMAKIAETGLWQSPSGKTPEATIYAAIIREIKAKGDAARFVKKDRGLFVANRP